MVNFIYGITFFFNANNAKYQKNATNAMPLHSAAHISRANSNVAVYTVDMLDTPRTIT